MTASANVELVRSIRTAWERGNFESSEWGHPRIEYVIADGPAPGRWTGRAALATDARSNLDTGQDFRLSLSSSLIPGDVRSTRLVLGLATG